MRRRRAWKQQARLETCPPLPNPTPAAKSQSRRDSSSLLLISSFTLAAVQQQSPIVRATASPDRTISSAPGCLPDFPLPSPAQHRAVFASDTRWMTPSLPSQATDGGKPKAQKPPLRANGAGGHATGYGTSRPTPATTNQAVFRLGPQQEHQHRPRRVFTYPDHDRLPRATTTADALVRVAEWIVGDASEVEDLALFADDEDSNCEDEVVRARRPFVKRKAKLQGRACQMCLRSKTPRWRRGPTGDKNLCNVCGLIYAKRESRRLRESWLLHVSRAS